MTRILWILGLGAAVAFSCTPPDRDIVVDGSLGGGAGADSGAGGSTGGGSSGGPSSGGNGGGGLDGESSGGRTGGTGGGSGGEPASCEDSDECTGVAAICDEDSGECRGCESEQECVDARPDTPLCDDGACVECVGPEDCPADEAICDGGTCRGCEEHSECESLVCRPDGDCEDESAVVYALAATGNLDDTCGTSTQPCRRLTDAVEKLGSDRPYLVFIPTTVAFEDFGALVLPAGVDVTILGNLVEIVSDENPVIVATGGNVHLDGLFMTGVGSEQADPDQVLVDATGGALSVTNSIFQDSYSGVSTHDTEVYVADSEFRDLYAGGVWPGCSTTPCPTGVPPATIVRNRFERNGSGATGSGLPDSYIANNLLIEVATISYSTGIDVRGAGTVVEFNTVVRSGNCAFNGLFYCVGDDSILLRGNITYESTTMGEGSGGTPCYNQVYSSCPSIEHSISEITIPGTGNVAADPLFVDYAGGDFHLSEDSPAVDLVPTGDSELENDLEGSSRPVGDGLDAGAFERQ